MGATQGLQEGAMLLLVGSSGHDSSVGFGFVLGPRVYYPQSRCIGGKRRHMKLKGFGHALIHWVGFDKLCMHVFVINATNITWDLALEQFCIQDVTIDGVGDRALGVIANLGTLPGSEARPGRGLRRQQHVWPLLQSVIHCP